MDERGDVLSGLQPQEGGKTPEEAGLSLLKNPARPSWLVGFQTRFTSTDPPAAWRDYLYGLRGS